MNLMHDAIRAPRHDIIGEVVYAQAWKQSLGYKAGDEDDEQAFKLILKDLENEPMQRDATIAATLIQWLGTNVGGTILIGLRQLQEAQNPNPFFRSRFYLSGWSTANHRQLAMNGGWRLLELLMSEEPGAVSEFGESGLPETRPTLTAHDYEVADHIMFWLGSDAGQRFIDDCEKELEIRCAAAGIPPRGAVIFMPQESDAGGPVPANDVQESPS